MKTMIIVMKPGAKKTSIDQVLSIISSAGLEYHLSAGKETTIIGVIGDKTRLSARNLEIAEEVDKVVPVTESYKLANRKFHPEDTVVKVGAATIGGGSFSVIAGPCSVESEEQIIAVAKDVQASGAALLRGGAFKPRTSP